MLHICMCIYPPLCVLLATRRMVGLTGVVSFILSDTEVKFVRLALTTAVEATLAEVGFVISFPFPVTHTRKFLEL